MKYFRNMYQEENNTYEHITTTISETTEITKEIIVENIKKLKNIKASGVGDILNKLLKYGSAYLSNQLKYYIKKLVTAELFLGSGRRV